MELIIISFLILLNGFFALSEIALVSSKKSRLEQLKKDGRKGSKTALRLLRNSEGFLSAIQVGITLIGIVTGVYGGINIADDITPLIQNLGLSINSSEKIALSVTILTITYFSIVIGELVPKTIALSNPEKIAIKIAPPIYYFSVLFYPFVKFLSRSTSLINRLLGVKKPSEQITEAELRQMLKLASIEGVIEKDQDLIHEKLFYFSDKKAKHIMTHRREVDWIDIEQPFNIVKSKILKSRHTRIVCCKESLDNFQGVLNVIDFLSAISLNDEIKINDMLFQPLIVPESAEAHNVLNQFRHKQVHFCIVVNE